MYFYEVYVGEIKHQNNDTLTYHSDADLEKGTIVRVPYGKKMTSGYISTETKKPKYKTRAIEEIISNSVLPAEMMDLRNWISSYYPYGGGSISRLFLPSGLNGPRLIEEKIEPHSSNLQATKEQKKIIDAIFNSNQRSHLLHGETGSGKTKIYLELTKKEIAKGKSVIILVPEITLISQIYEIFLKEFGNITKTLSSNLTKKEYRSNWLYLLESKIPTITIGTRSAVFSPVSNLGMIFVDEMHEPAYKQDSAPRYNALRVAARRSQISGSKIVYGSATPLIAEYHLAKITNTPILEIFTKAKETKKVSKAIIDLKAKNRFSKHPYLSDDLLQAIEIRIKKKEQSLIFLNRRGTAKQIVCQDCGWQNICPKCDLPLTFHADSHKTRCHTCGFESTPPYSCQDCGNSNILYKSLGTKGLVEILKDYFPQANIMRFDTDNLKKEMLSSNFEDVKSGKVDILVGTQMLGKGLDLPKLSLVGLVNADMSLSMPDYSSVERNYQLIHQSIGRVGRGHVDGEVILQTFQPEDKLLKAALNQDWKYLYETEINERKKFTFPPYCFMLKVSTSRKTSDSAEKFINKLREEIIGISPNIEVSDSTPSFYEKSFGKYNWQIVIKSPDRTSLTKIINRLNPGDYTYDIDPLNLL